MGDNLLFKKFGIYCIYLLCHFSTLTTLFGLRSPDVALFQGKASSKCQVSRLFSLVNERIIFRLNAVINGSNDSWDEVDAGLANTNVWLFFIVTNNLSVIFGKVTVQRMHFRSPYQTCQRSCTNSYIRIHQMEIPPHSGRLGSVVRFHTRHSLGHFYLSAMHVDKQPLNSPRSNNRHRQVMLPHDYEELVH